LPLMRRFCQIWGILAILIAACVSSCKKDEGFDHATSTKTNISGQRTGSDESRHVLVLYLAGHNSLSKYMKGDYEDLLEGYIPQNISRADNVLLVYSQQTKENYNYSEPLESHLFRLYTDQTGKVVADTLKTYGEDYVSADTETLKQVLNDVKYLFPAKSYGMILSSHATGWLPAGYTTTMYTLSRVPRMNSIGQTQTGTNGDYTSYEMDLKKFAKAIPMSMEYILFDACLMGCVEVAYELKNVCHYVGFSPTEVVADGYDYKTLTTRLLKGDPDPCSVCEDFFAQYLPEVSSTPYCTTTFIDCTKMKNLALVCENFFASHRSELAAVDPNKVQGYFRFGWHWFYDLKDVIKNAGATEAELKAVQDALDECVLLNEATPTFISFQIKTHCGLSMYLPCDGSSVLDYYYRDLKWNNATNLL